MRKLRNAVGGWSNEEQLDYLMREVRSLKDGSAAVEVGVWMGRSALAMATACKGTRKKIYAVDPWADYDSQTVDLAKALRDQGVQSMQQVYEIFLENRRKLRLEEWVVVCRKQSVSAASAWAHGPVGMIFIDGDHAEEAVAADLAAWVPLVRPGGLVCGDDWNWPGVRAGVEKFLSRRGSGPAELPLENTWAFRVIGERSA